MSGDIVERLFAEMAADAAVIMAKNAEIERLRAAGDALAKPGDRIVNGDQMGTIVTCPTCDGDGILHDPDEKPEPSTPEGGPS